MNLSFTMKNRLPKNTPNIYQKIYMALNYFKRNCQTEKKRSSLVKASLVEIQLLSCE